MESVGTIEITSKELRARVIEFGRKFSGDVEHSANRIMEVSSDPEVRRNALLWKMHAVPAVQEAVLHMDPLMGVLEAWGLCLQMRNFFASGDGSELFGAQQPIAQATSESLVERAERFAEAVSSRGTMTDARDQLRVWAERHPLETLNFQRPTVTASGANLLRTGARSGAFATVADLDAAAREGLYRLGLYNEYLLKEVRWHSQLFAEDLLKNDEIVSTLAVTRESLQRLTILAESLPETVQEERQLILEALTAERLAILEALSLERAMILDRVGEERREVLEAVMGERARVLDALHAETEFAMDELDATTDSAFVASRDLVDHAFWRLAQLLAVAGAITFVAMLILILVFRGSGRGRVVS